MFKSIRSRKTSKPPPPDYPQHSANPNQPVPSNVFQRIPPNHGPSYSVPSPVDFKLDVTLSPDPFQSSRPADLPLRSNRLEAPPHPSRLDMAWNGQPIRPGMAGPEPGQNQPPFRTHSPGSPPQGVPRNSPIQHPPHSANGSFVQQGRHSRPTRPATSPHSGSRPPQQADWSRPPQGVSNNPNNFRNPEPISPPPTAQDLPLELSRSGSVPSSLNASQPNSPTPGGYGPGNGLWRQPTSPSLSPGLSHHPNYSRPLNQAKLSPTPSMKETNHSPRYSPHPSPADQGFPLANSDPTHSHRRPPPPLLDNSSQMDTRAQTTRVPSTNQKPPSSPPKHRKRQSRKLSLERPLTPESARELKRASRQTSLDSGQLRLAYQVSRPEEETSYNHHDRAIGALGGASMASVALTTFYATNSHTISSVSMDLTTEDASSNKVEAMLSTFGSAAKVLVKGLDSLAHYYPAIAIAAQAFKLVLELDIQRRENNKKVGLVRIQLADTMAVLFELRNIKDPEEIGPDGQTMGRRLQTLMIILARDIKNIGNGCDLYLAKGVLAKTVKAHKYENRLSSFITLLATHKKNLHFALTAHTASGVDSANEKLNEQTSQMKKMEEKLEIMLRTMETARERELMAFIDEKGGAARCVSNTTLLEVLVQKSGETMASLSGGRGNSKEEELASIKKFLQKELAETVDESFSRNMSQFQGKLLLAEKRIAEHITSEADRVIQALQDGAHSRIMDQDIQDIWKDMGWKGSSVKARHFVVALHDFFSDRLAKTQENGEESQKANEKSDRWALSYINVAHVQPILESVDDDCTGWITITEVNNFVKDRPAAWSLPYWLAFWAVGWHTSVTRYRNKIYSLIQKMFGLLDHVLPPNKQAVNEYLMNHSIWKLELLLRSTTPASSALASDTELNAMSSTYSKMEEVRLEHNLEPLLYIIESTTTIPLICGPGRLERYLYPLIYVLLKRHFQLLLLSCEHVLDEDELEVASGSLLNIFTLVDSRIENLEDIFKQTDSDVASRLTNYAFGMFKLSFGDVARNPRENSYATWSEFGAFTEEDDLNTLNANEIPFDILKYGVKDEVGFEAFQPDSVLPSSRIDHPMNGLWTGYLYRISHQDYVSTQGLIQISIGLIENGQIEGGGETYSGLLTCSGDARPADNSILKVSISLIYSDGFTTKCVGEYNPWNESISGTWKILEDGGDVSSLENSLESQNDDFTRSGQTSEFDLSEESITDQLVFSPPASPPVSPLPNIQIFQFTRTAPWLQRFRPPKKEFDPNPGRGRARWKFACHAILHEVKRSRWWWDFFRTRFAERRMVVDLTTRSQMYLKGFTIAPEDALSDADRAQLAHLRHILSPGDARFYSIVADIEIQKLPWHIGENCDACERELIKWRHICTHCINSTFSDQVDLCIACVNSKVTLRGFTHDPSHVLVRTEQVLHDHMLAKTIRDARTITERTKEYFRTIERHARAAQGLKQAGTHEAFKRGPTESQMNCAYCNKIVSPPMWVCVVCAPDAFVCETCVNDQELSASEGAAPGHLPSHTLASVRDTTSVAENSISTETRIVGLEKKLTTLESNFEARILAMEQTMEERMNSMENLLMQIATSLSSREIRQGYRGH